MMRCFLPLLPLLGACHLGYLSPSGELPEGDTDTDVDTDADTDTAAPGCDLWLHELGDDQDSSEALGELTPDVAICGDLGPLSNDGAAYTGDFDWADFTAASGGDWRFELSWAEAGSDLDLFVVDGNGAILAGVATGGTTQPEVLDLPITAGERYGFAVVGWSGLDTNYMLTLR